MKKKHECISIVLRDFIDNYAVWDFIGFNYILIKF